MTVQPNSNPVTQLRIGVVGAGSMARRFYLPSLAHLAAKYPLELSALCDVNVAAAEALARTFGFANAFDSLDRLLAAVPVSAVWLLVPTAAMPALARTCLERGLPVLLEKPPAEDAEQTRDLVRLASATNTPNQVAFNRRYAPLMRQARQLGVEQQLPHYISCQFYRTRRTEAIFPYSTGLHGLDAVRFLGGSEVTRVRCEWARGNARVVRLDFASGCEALVELIPNSGVQSERYTIHSGERTIVVDGAIPWLTHFPGALQRYEGGQLAEAIPAPSGADWELGGFYGQSEAFAASLLAGQRPGPDLAEALRSVEVAEAAQRAEALAFNT